MDALPHFFENNRRWAAAHVARNPDFFELLSEQQAPKHLWIGCSDSRVPANDIVGLLPGELFVHRNVANVVTHADLNCLSVLQYAVDVLKVEHVMVVGHYGCGGVAAAYREIKAGLVDNWLRYVQDVKAAHLGAFEGLDEHGAIARLCELNVLEQVLNVGRTTVIQDAWARGQAVTLHGWIYGLRDGHLHELTAPVSDVDRLREFVAQLRAT
ncbi:MAG: carbonate dehydratase [Gemmatimonadaceae bacterium]|nr:carbonate dehydratase [Gemmatimonadaceae bacterium]